MIIQAISAPLYTPLESTKLNSEGTNMANTAMINKITNGATV
jgi:hypothetical protein